MNVLTAMTQLWINRTGPTTSNSDAAAWFAARTALHKQLAKLAGGPGSARARALVTRAQERSAELLAITRLAEAD